jgi:ADP-heptose:LPS heptosyltransferase
VNLPFADAWLAGAARRALPDPPLIESLDIKAVKRVLLVLTTGLGDAVFSSAAFAPIRQTLPQARITLFVRRAWAPLFMNHPHIDAVIEYAGKYRAWFATLRALKAAQPELAVVLHGNDPDIIPLCALSGSRYIVRVPTQGTRHAALLANRERAQDAQTVPGLHYVDNRVRVLDALHLPVPLGAAPELTVDAPSREAMRARLHVLTGGRAWWVLHARAADAYKSIDAPLAHALIQQALDAYPNIVPVITGSAEDAAFAQALCAGITSSASQKPISLAGQTTLLETAALLSDARAVVAPDTGVLHLAAALGAPVVGLFAPTRHELVGPRGPGAQPITLQKPLTCTPCLEKQCPHRPVKCMAQFEVTELLQALGAQLGRAA